VENKSDILKFAFFAMRYVIYRIGTLHDTLDLFKTYLILDILRNSNWKVNVYSKSIIL